MPHGSRHHRRASGDRGGPSTRAPRAAARRRVRGRPLRVCRSRPGRGDRGDARRVARGRLGDGSRARRVGWAVVAPADPGWRVLNGELLETVVAQQWRAITDVALSDLKALDPSRWCTAEYDRLLADPRAELQRLCDFLDIPYDQALLSPLEDAARFVTPPPAADAPAAPAESPFRSSHTAGIPQALHTLRSSLLLSTYQTGKLVCARERDGELNTHFRNFDKPMGIAVAPRPVRARHADRGVGLPRHPDVAPKLEPAGTHDACYLPRNRHITGDIAIHEMAFAQRRAVDGRDRVLVPGDARRRPQLRPALEAAVRQRARPGRPLPPQRPRGRRRPRRATSPRSAGPTSPAAGARTRRTAAC